MSPILFFIIFFYLHIDDTNEAAQTWSSQFLDIADKHLPLKQHRVKSQQQPKRLTGEIIDAIRTRERYKYINDNEQYKIWRNNICSMIKQSKKKFWMKMQIILQVYGNYSRK